MRKVYTFSTLARKKTKSCPEVLFIEHDTNTRNTPMHAHDFWQLELATSGRFDIKSSKVNLKALTNDCILIPPGISHRILYGKKEQSSWSIEFKLETHKKLNEIILLKSTTASINARNNILEVFDEINTTYDSYLSLQYLLGLLIELELQEATSSLGSILITKTKWIIDSYAGRPITINELANKLEYSRSGISKKFHAETGVTLKEFIDSHRAQIATKMLLYSDQKIITIAEIMGFIDIYSFSRFFNRIYGCSPRQYRIKNKTT